MPAKKHIKSYETEYITNIRIDMHEDIHVWIDNEDLYIYESDGKMTDSFLQYMLHVFTQLKPKFDEDKSWHWYFLYGVDYCNFEIEQLSWNTIRIKTAFTDDTDKTEKLCDAKTFWEKILEEVEVLLDKIANHDTIYQPSSFLRSTSVKNLQDVFFALEEFYSKYY